VNAATVLVRHGIAAEADAGTLLAELAARGWEASVEEREEGGRHRQPLFHALAFRHRSPGAGWSSDHRQGSGRTPEAALRQVLAAVLEQEG
jgi:hypothetical protein